MVRTRSAPDVKLLTKGALQHDFLHEWATPPDGNCLFSSVAGMLRRTSDDAASSHRLQKVDETLSRHGQRWKCSDATPTILRHMVASCALDETCTILNHAIPGWIEIARALEAEQDRAMMIEYEHVRCIMDAKDPTKLTRNERRRLYASMSHRNFWGEQVALQILKQFLGIALLVVDGQGSVLFQFDADEKLPESGLYALLHLSGRHYTPLSRDGQFLFYENELPFAISRQIVDMDVHGRILSKQGRETVMQADAAWAAKSRHG